MNYFSRNIRNQSYHSIIAKLFTALALVSFAEIAISGLSFFSPSFFGGISIFSHISLVITLFALLFLCVPKEFDAYILIFSLLCLFFITNIQEQSSGPYFALVCSVVMGGVIFYFADSIKNFSISSKTTKILCFSFGVFMAVFIGVLTIYKYLAHWTPNYDFGIFSQMYHYMKETFIPYTTTERDKLLSHFAVHFSPILYVLLPFYFIFPSPATLLASQAILVALGIIPLYKLMRHYNLSNAKIAVLSFIYALYPVLIRGNFYYFHENCFLTVLLLWLFYFTETKRHVLSYIFAFSVMMVKEDAPVYIIFFAAYLLLSNKDKIKGLVLALLSSLYFVIVTNFMKAYGTGIMTYRYKNFIFEADGSIYDVIINLVKNPAYLFREILSPDKLAFLIYMAIPIALLSFAAKKPSTALLLLPMLLMNLMTDYVYQYDIGFQYIYGSAAFLFYAAVINLNTLSGKTAKKMLLCGAAASVIFFASASANKFSAIASYYDSQSEIKIINEALAKIPKDAEVTATTFLVTPISDRKVLYQYEYTDKTTEYLVFDLRYNSSEYNIETYKNDSYEEVYFAENVIAIFRMKN